MSTGPASMRRARQQGGYALLMVMFLLALLIVATMAVVPNVLTEGRREKEEEMIWRGQQYIRGVKLYYQKRGRFPTSLEDLTKPKTGLRFMRQAYKDPMNPEDGSWRLIYVGAAGQLIGSLKPPQQNLQMPQMGGASVGTPAASLNGPNSFSSGQQGQTGQQGIASSPGQTASGSTPGTNPSAPGGGQEGTPGTGDTNSMSTPQSLTPLEGTTIIGGNIIGVGSKINKRSIKWYDKAKNYRQFEFIWDPSKDLAGGGQSLPIAAPGESPFGGQRNPPNQPTNPTSPSQTPNPNPNPNPQQ